MANHPIETDLNMNTHIITEQPMCIKKPLLKKENIFFILLLPVIFLTKACHSSPDVASIVRKANVVYDSAFFQTGHPHIPLYVANGIIGGCFDHGDVPLDPPQGALFEHLALVLDVALHAVDEVGHQVEALLQHHRHAGEGLVDRVARRHHGVEAPRQQRQTAGHDPAVVDLEHPEREQEQRAAEDPDGVHGRASREALSTPGRPPLRPAQGPAQRRRWRPKAPITRACSCAWVIR